MTARINIDNIHIVLMQPRYPENIGSAARAMRNMGLCHLSVVDPENFDLSRAFKLATHVAADVIESCRTYDDLKEALALLSVCGRHHRPSRQTSAGHPDT